MTEAKLGRTGSLVVLLLREVAAMGCCFAFLLTLTTIPLIWPFPRRPGHADLARAP
jgi:hypothetical protein